MLPGQPAAVGPSVRPREPGPGDQLGRYVIVSVLGRGGMGTVYAAHDPGLERKVAVKLLHAAVQQQRLVREAKALAKLAHPNVVGVYDVGSVDARTFVAMEFIDGWTIRDWLEAAPRTWREVVEVYLDAARGLAAAHDAGLVHRDFKPDNVLIGRDGRARVLDFGIVSEVASGRRLEATPPPEMAPPPITRPVALPSPGETLAAPPPGRLPNDAAPDDEHARLTQTGSVMGTPAYMAPEQFRSEPADARSDQFAFAVSLWESLFGERPFRSRNFAGLMLEVTSGRLSEPPNPGVAPRWLHRILRRALATDPAGRYPSMTALATDLRRSAETAEARVPLGGGRYTPIDGPGDGTGPRRLLDRLTDHVVTLQPILLEPLGGALDVRVGLARELMQVMALDHPHVVRVLDFGVDEEWTPFVVLDEAATAEPLTEHARRSSLPARKNLLSQLLGAIGYLHRRELVHGDLGPAHVRVSQGQLKLLVLGRAVLPAARAHGASLPPGGELMIEPARELGLRAPEVARGDPPTAASDPWSFGVLARRVLGEDVSIEPGLGALLDRLTAADPAARFGSASEAAAALGRALGGAAVLDTAETRDNFLQAARLVGREAELGALEGALRAAMQGRGSAWLVSGESGVGKSRLVDELRVRAHAGGALVLRGQAEPTADAYGPWREVLRALALVSEVSDFDASVLLPIVPDLPRLLGRGVVAAPELEGPSVHARLREVVLRVLRRQARPLVLVFEDLQWASSATLELLRVVEAAAASELALLLLGTYRSEDRPQLARELAGFRALPLARLDGGSVQSLVASVLGAARTTPELVALLARESEGNAFFIVESLRALADEAGGVDKIGERALPERVLAGGIRRVLRRRLERVPAEARGALRVAAVFGRRVDPVIISRVCPELDLEAWIRIGLASAVLSRSGQEVRFAHDKLRDELLDELGPEDRRTLHATVARAIEAVHGADASQAAALALHYRAAGDAAAEARFTALSGELALAHGAHREAAERLERARALRPTPSPEEHARLHAQLGQAYLYLLDFPRAKLALSAATAPVGVSVPSPGARRGWFTLRQLLAQVRHRWLGVRVSYPAERATLFHASRAAATLANVLVFENDSVGVLSSSLLAVNLSERAGTTNHLSLSLLGFAAGAVGLTELADAYFARLHQAPPEPGELRGVASGAVAESMAYLGRGRLELAERRAQENLALVERIGDRVNRGYTIYALGVVAFYRGALDEALDLFTTAQQGLDPDDARHGAVNFASWEILVASTLGRSARAEQRLESTRGIFGPHDRASEGIWHGVHALVLARGDRLDEARAAVREALRCVPSWRSAPPTAGGLIAGLIETALLGLARARTPEQAREARRALLFGERWSKTYPIGRPALLVYRARYAKLMGEPARAQGFLEQAAALARAQGNVLGEAAATRALASGI